MAASQPLSIATRTVSAKYPATTAAAGRVLNWELKGRMARSKPATLNDVAALANVSRATAARAKIMAMLATELPGKCRRRRQNSAIEVIAWRRRCDGYCQLSAVLSATSRTLSSHCP